MTKIQYDKMISSIEKRLKNHDFGGEIIDDRWDEYIINEAIGYLTANELGTLDGYKDHDAVMGGMECVLREYLRYMCKKYGVKLARR